ncbi:hypothetical protein HETIRDRAFT_243529, partial [Heterobasidion irregulare TC 32-1]
MCHFRRYAAAWKAFPRVNCHSFVRVKNLFLYCGHSQELPEQLVRISSTRMPRAALTGMQIECESTTCKFSRNHPNNCRPPTCKNTCWQYRQFPEQY